MLRLPVLRFALLACVLFSGAVQAQTTHTVQQVLFTFVPADITIELGDTIDFVWTSQTHTVTEGLGPLPTGGEAFDEILNVPTPLASVLFDGKFVIENSRAGHFYNYYCIPHFSQAQLGTITVLSPWSNDGNALAGTNGEPLLYGNGPLTAGSPAELVLENALPNSLVALFISFSSTPSPFKGGVLCTIPIAVQATFPIGPTGSVTLADTIPPGLPSGTEVFWQYGIQDAGGPFGIALSNCLRSTFP